MKKILTLMAAAAAMMTAGCNKDLHRTEGPRTIAIDPLITRATETDFETGDKVGLTITRGVEVFADNYCMSYDGSKFTGDLLWYTEGEQNSTFTAYYPYSDSVPSAFSVYADQSGDNYGASDLMAAVKDEVTPQNAVTMVFKHLMTRIVVDIDNQVGAEISSVILKGSVHDAEVDIPGMSATVAEGQAGDIIMHAVSANTRYAAIVVPQTVKFSVTIAVDGGRTITKSLSSVTLKAGGQYTIKAVVVAGDMSVAISGEIENWSDEGVIPEKQVTFEEFDGYFIYDDIRYNTAVLPDGNTWMTDNLRFVPEGKVPSSTPGDGNGIWYPYTADGKAAVPATDEATIAANGYLYDYNTLLGKKITADNLDEFDGIQGICPKGWHVPTRAEYYALCGNSTRSVYLNEPTGTRTDADAYFYDAAVSSGSVVKFNEGGFNFPIVGTIANNAYSALILDNSVCDLTEYYGKPRMTYLATSSPNTATQFFGLMTTFSATMKPGKVSLSYATVEKSAVALRCVKNK